MASRRHFLQALTTSLLGAAAAASATPLARQQQDALTAMFTQTNAADPPWALLNPLRTGSSVGKGWRIASLGGVERGAAVLTLEHNDGRRARVHLCASNGTPIGPAHSKSIDLLLMDGGNGVKQTEEDLGRVLKAIARRITVNERSLGNNAGAFLAQLQSHQERVATYGAGTLI